MSKPVSSLVVSVTVRFLSVSSTAESVAHTCTVSSYSITRSMAGTDTDTSTCRYKIENTAFNHSKLYCVAFLFLDLSFYEAIAVLSEYVNPGISLMHGIYDCTHECLLLHEYIKCISELPHELNNNCLTLWHLAILIATNHHYLQ